MRLHPLALCALLLIALMVVVDITRPLIPIDETRYLTVAWEFLSRGEWILPTLNYAPYSHKPPMLFWLINTAWAVVGDPSVWAARLVPLFASISTLCMTYIIGRTLWPDARATRTTAIFMMISTPFLLIYGSLIMFDTLLCVAVLVGIYAMLKFYLTGHRGFVFLLGLAFAAGGLIKGPVILVHLLPVLLLFPLCARPFVGRKSVWYQGVIFAVAIGVLGALAWALPAAHLGGPDYERMIFWGQSAGRMVKAFDHAKPFWFYAALFPLLVMPWIFMAPLYKRINRETGAPRTTWQARFLLCWIIPVFVAFSAISGKQVHYIIPMMPGLFLLLAHRAHLNGTFATMRARTVLAFGLAPVVLLFVTFIILEYMAHHTNWLPESSFVTQLDMTVPAWLILAVVMMAAAWICIAFKYKDALFARALPILAVCASASIMALHANLSPALSHYYNLSHVSDVVHDYAQRQKQVAVANPWEGELGYLARLPRAVTLITEKDIKSWFAKNPGSIVILRHKTDKPPKHVKIIDTHEYRSPGKSISILRK